MSGAASYKMTSAERLPRQSDEHSPLLSPIPSRVSSISTEFERPILHIEHHDEGQETKSTLYLFLLVLSVGGLQIAWCVELSNGTPYLLSLGLSKSLMALVWIAGPLSGTLVQPYVGIRSDNCRIRWGKRKPFMIAGALATIFSLLMLAWTRDICRSITGLFGADPTASGTKNFTIVVAVLLVYILDFAINTGMHEYHILGLLNK
jgi:solute carrier family 45 protein 1/2/4